MRKSLLFGLAAATSLALAGPVLAQDAQTQSGQSSTSSSTASNSPSTVTGTVVSSSDSQLVVDTPAGRQTFTVVSGTSDVPTGLTAGTQVTVEYTASGDQRTVSRVTTGASSSTSPYGSTTSSSSTTPPSATTSPRSTTSGTYNSGQSSQYGSTGPSTDRDNDMTRTTRHHDRRAGSTNDENNPNGAANENLPATASPAFLVGLLGLLSLGGSALVRTLRRLL